MSGLEIFIKIVEMICKIVSAVGYLRFSRPLPSQLGLNEQKK